MSQRTVFGIYLLLLLLQPVWHFFLPRPWGANSWILAIIVSLPLLLPLKGIITGHFRSMIWGGFLAVLYFLIGVMEAWSNPPQRIPAVIQIALSLGYCGALVIFSRRTQPNSSASKHPEVKSG